MKVLVTIGYLFLWCSISYGGRQDTDGPRLVDLIRWPDTVDRTAADKADRTVTYRWHVTSTSPMWRGGIAMASESRRQGQWTTWKGTELISGTLLDGIYESKLLIYPHYDIGIWSPKNSRSIDVALWLDDTTRHRTSYYDYELQSLFDLDVVVGPIPEPFLPGDANQDYVFDQADLVDVFLANIYATGKPATWETGDWNNDRLFDRLDVVAALQTGNYLQGPYAAVPEPSTWLLLAIGGFALGFISRILREGQCG